MDQVSRSAPFDVRVDQNLNYASLTHLGQELAELVGFRHLLPGVRFGRGELVVLGVGDARVVEQLADQSVYHLGGVGHGSKRRSYCVRLVDEFSSEPTYHDHSAQQVQNHEGVRAKHT